MKPTRNAKKWIPCPVALDDIRHLSAFNKICYSCEGFMAVVPLLFLSQFEQFFGTSRDDLLISEFHDILESVVDI